MIPDGEKLLSNYLRDLIGVRVVGKTPATVEEPWIRVTQLDAPQSDVADHLIGFYCQLDIYAGADGGQPEAKDIAADVREALRDIGSAEHTDAVVSGARVNGVARIPDTDLEPARERVVMTTTIWAHP